MKITPYAQKGKSILIAAALILPGIALAQDTDDPNPYLKPDDTWISISGTAVDTQPASFTLDYGEGVLTVEMDDWDWYGDTPAGIEGDKVTVYGEVDDDFFEMTTIEASSVYVENRGTYYFASAADEESAREVDLWVDYTPIVVGQTVVRGTIQSVDGRTFTVDTGLREIQVDTITMPYNPMDEKGFQQLAKGDYVSVSGNMDVDFWEGRELMADTVITLSDG